MTSPTWTRAPRSRSGCWAEHRRLHPAGPVSGNGDSSRPGGPLASQGAATTNGRTAVPEGHTIHRLARELQRAFGRRPVAASTLQERFADGAAMLDGATHDPHRSARQAPVPDLPGASAGGPVAAHPSRPVREIPDRGRTGAGSAGRAAAADRERHGLGGPARTDGLRADHATGTGRDHRPARPGPAARRRRPGTGLGQDLPVQDGDRRPADVAGRAVRDRQRLPRRGAVPASGQPLPRGPVRDAARNGTRSGPTSACCCGPASGPGGSSPRCRRIVRGAGGPEQSTGARIPSMCTAGPASPAGSAGPRSAPR